MRKHIPPRRIRFIDRTPGLDLVKPVSAMAVSCCHIRAAFKPYSHWSLKRLDDVLTNDRQMLVSNKALKPKPIR